jgi:hypothetical protein
MYYVKKKKRYGEGDRDKEKVSEEYRHLDREE